MLTVPFPENWIELTAVEAVMFGEEFELLLKQTFFVPSGTPLGVQLAAVFQLPETTFQVKSHGCADAREATSATRHRHSLNVPTVLKQRLPSRRSPAPHRGRCASEDP